MIEPDRPVQAATERGGLVANLVEQPNASGRRTKQADIRNGAVRERSEISLVRQQVMAHDDRRVVLPGLQFLRQFGGDLERNASGSGKAIGDGVRGR